MINFQFQPYANGFFSDRDNLDEAFEYAHDVMAALPAEHRIAAYAALYVIINTAARVEREALAKEQKRQPVMGAVETVVPMFQAHMGSGATLDEDALEMLDAMDGGCDREDVITIHKVKR